MLLQVHVPLPVPGPLQTVPPVHPEQHRRRGHRALPSVHQPGDRVPLRDGHRGEAASGAHQARAHAHVEDSPEHRQPRGVLEGAAHALLQRVRAAQLRGRQKILHSGKQREIINLQC